MSTLYVRAPEGYRVAEPAEIFDRARALIAQRYRSGSPVLGSPALTRDYLKFHIGPSDHEQFGVVHLDSRHRLICAEILFRGTLANASVYPREVVKAALARNSAAVVFFHNHPSGIPEPSQADEVITSRLKEALALVEVRVLDHLIVAESIFSFSESGLL
jgi:DNA repair protein RadC